MLVPEASLTLLTTEARARAVRIDRRVAMEESGMARSAHMTRTTWAMGTSQALNVRHEIHICSELVGAGEHAAPEGLIAAAGGVAELCALDGYSGEDPKVCQGGLVAG